MSTLPDLEQATSVKHLGIVIYNNLTWHNHVDMIYGRLSAATFI